MKCKNCHINFKPTQFLQKFCRTNDECLLKEALYLLDKKKKADLKKSKKETAGHYFNANNHYNVRFNEDNVHKQCEYCNTSLSGNLIPYRKYLIMKIGVERFEKLEEIAYLTRKFTIEEVKQI